MIEAVSDELTISTTKDSCSDGSFNIGCTYHTRVGFASTTNSDKGTILTGNYAALKGLELEVLDLRFSTGMQTSRDVPDLKT